MMEKKQKDWTRREGERPQQKQPQGPERGRDVDPLQPEPRPQQPARERPERHEAEESLNEERQRRY